MIEVTRSSAPVGWDVTVVEAVNQRPLCRAGLIAFPREKLHELLDIVVPQIDTQNLASVGPDPEYVIRHIDTIDDEQGTILPTNDEPPRLIFHRLDIPDYPLYG